MESTNKLKELYQNVSKHSNYQILPASLIDILESDDLTIQSRYEKERWDYISHHVSVDDARCLDIGGNSGYFTFSAYESGAESVIHYEGNHEHSDFVQEAARVLDIDKHVRAVNDYFLFDNSYNEKFDVTLLLNVLHHLGDDYGDDQLGKEDAKNHMITQLNNMAGATKILVFQMGYCWQGDRNKLLFENGTKSEMIDFIKSGTQDHWEILQIGIAEKVNDKVHYASPSESNLKRNDGMGEFLNRPIFILRSKVY